MEEEVYIVIAHSLVRNAHFVDSAAKDRDWLVSTLDNALKNHSNKKVIKCELEGVFQGDESGNSIQDSAVKLLERLLEHQNPSQHSPIIWVGHGIGGTIIKKAIVLAALDRSRYRNICAATNLFVFLDCLHRATYPCEITNRVAQWLCPSVDMRCPVLLRSITDIGAHVAELNQLFLEAKLHQFVRVVSIYSKESALGTPLTRLNASLGTIYEQVLCLSDDNNPERTRDTVANLVEEAAGSRSAAVLKPWLQVFYTISPYIQSTFDPMFPKTPHWLLQNEVFSTWCKGRCPLAVALYGPRAASVLSAFSSHGDYESYTLYFKFNSHDNRQDSAISMVTLFIAQILSRSDHDWFQEYVQQKWHLRAWSLYDALQVLLKLINGVRYVFVLENFDECDQASRQAFLATMDDLLSLTENNFKLLVTSKYRLEGWHWMSLNTEEHEQTRSNSDLGHAPDAQSAKGESDSLAIKTGDYSKESLWSDGPQTVLQGYVEVLAGNLSIPKANLRYLAQLVLSITEIDLRRFFLSQFEKHISPSVVEKILSLQQPLSVESYFHHVLNSIPVPCRQVAREILCWVLTSVRPLSTQELNAIISLIRQREGLDTGFKGETSANSSVKDFLWGLFTIESNGVSICHPFLRHLLLGPGTEWFRVGKDSHLQVLNSCLEFLTQEDLMVWSERTKSFQCRIDKLGDILIAQSMLEDRQTLHQYVIANWPIHYHRIPEESKPRDAVVHFFKEDCRGCWESWAESRWIMANPLTRAEEPQKSALSLLAEVGDLKLMQAWAGANNPTLTEMSMALVAASRAGKKDIVEHLLPSVLSRTAETTLQGALIAAASSANCEILMLLISVVPQNFTWPTNLLTRVSELGHENCVKALLARNCSPNYAIHDIDDNPFSMALKNGHTGVYSLLLTVKASISGSPDTGMAIRMAAGTPRGADIIRLLTHNGVDVERSYASIWRTLRLSCKMGFFKVTQTLAEVLTSDKKPKIPILDSCLNIAIRMDYVRTTESILGILDNYDDATFVISDILRYSAMHASIEIFRILLPKCFTRGSLPEPEQRILFYYACISQHAGLELIRLLVDHGADINLSSGPRAPLTIAAGMGRLEHLRYLIDHGASVNMSDMSRNSALSEAARHGNLECVRYLLDNGADIDWRDRYNETALFEAAANEQFDIAHLLLERGAATSGRGWDGRTIIALCLSSTDIMRKVLNRCSEVDTKDDYGLTPLHHAALKRNSDAIAVLLEFGADIDIECTQTSHQHTALSLAALEGDVQSINLLLEGGADVDHKAPGLRCTALHHAQSLDAIGALLQYSPNLDLADSEGKTALHYRASEENPDFAVIKKLVNARASINILCQDGCCSPMWSLVEDIANWPIIQYLIKKGADVNMADSRSGSVLHRACNNGNFEMVKNLHLAGTDAETAVSGYRGSPLQAACQSGAGDSLVLEIIEYLILEAKANVNQVCGSFGTAINTACLRKSAAAITLLLKHGATVDVADGFGRLPIHLASVTAFDNLLHLIELGCDVNIADKTGRTVLQWAVQSGDPKTVRRIVSLSNTAVEQKDKDGWTALCWACRGTTTDTVEVRETSPDDQAEIVQLLLEHGASLSLSVRGDANQMWSPLQIAIFHDSGERVIDLLNKAQEIFASGPLDRMPFSSAKGRQHNGVYCDSCLSILVGTRYVCKSCPDFDFCFKCYIHRRDIHEPSHEFEENGPAWDETQPADEQSQSGDGEESESGDSESVEITLED
ncbi:ankyrin repeat [Fusarium pseudoanthophilum]|uniref:Ankyrin repeat n=1 Tax=Fusarium pseudoanthophilum TaxID=48495 RepID=A0A8H5KH12_9HYPO|nr:ankyrin repeat [Fusarium pseudoanthophilum]